MGLTETQAKAQGIEIEKAVVPLGRERTRACHGARRRHDQADLRQEHAPAAGRGHGGPQCRRADRRNGAGPGDGGGRGGHRRSPSTRIRRLSETVFFAAEIAEGSITDCTCPRNNRWSCPHRDRFTGAGQSAGGSRTRPALWFAFQGAQMLVLRDDAGSRLPSAADPGELGLVATRSQYLGVLGEQHCYACELREDSAPPTGMQLSGLRALFGAIDDSLFALAGRAFQIVDWDRSHQFCGRCGTPTRQRLNERARECPSCGQVHYPRIAPAVMALVRRGNELLLARSPHFPPGMYSALAGFVEPGETLEQTTGARSARGSGHRYQEPAILCQPAVAVPAFTDDSVLRGLRRRRNHAGAERNRSSRLVHGDRLPQALPGKISISRRLIDSAMQELGAGT